MHALEVPRHEAAGVHVLDALARKALVAKLYVSVEFRAHSMPVLCEDNVVGEAVVLYGIETVAHARLGQERRKLGNILPLRLLVVAQPLHAHGHARVNTRGAKLSGASYSNHWQRI